MIAVTGFARSGTSMVMQTLMHLGVPMSAPAFIPENEDIRELNPKGFYELNLAGGIKDDRYKGMAVKLFPWQLANTGKPKIAKLIYIVRNDKDVLKSFEKVKGHALVPVDINGEELLRFCKTLVSWCIDQDTMCVTYEEVCLHPEWFVNDLILYLQLSVTAEQKEKAIKNIKK